MSRQHYKLQKLKLHITYYKHKYYKGIRYKNYWYCKNTRIVTEIQSYERKVCVRKYDWYDVKTKKRKMRKQRNLFKTEIELCGRFTENT